MKIVFKIGITILIFILIFACSIISYLHVDDSIESRIDNWENAGRRHISKLNEVISSNWSWGTKKNALFAIEKILDDSSIPTLVKQLHYKGHWWQYWWDYEEMNSAASFRQDVMYVLERYGNKALGFLERDLRVKNQKASKEIIIAIGVIGTETASKKLTSLRNDSNWHKSRNVIEQSLELVSTKRSELGKILLKEEDVDAAISELENCLGKKTNPTQSANLNSLINDLGALRIKRSRDVLKEIIEVKYDYLKEAAIRALGRIGNPADTEFLTQYVFDKDIDVRREAIIALGLLKNNMAKPALEKVLQDKYEAPRNKDLAREALRQIA